MQPGHSKIERKIKLRVRVKGNFTAFKFNALTDFLDFVRVISPAQTAHSSGLLRTIGNIETVARNQAVIELLLILDHFHAKKDATEQKRENQENGNKLLLAGL